jgi:nicotinate-nucleotide adenylyltransferase
MPNVILLGGSFNPVHMGHVFAACYLTHLGLFDEVLVVPVCKHPYGKDLVEFHHRHEMCRLAMSWIPRVTISDIEKHIIDLRLSTGHRTDVAPNYTCDTVAALKELHPGWKIFFAIGSDNDKVEQWEGGQRLLSMAKPFVIGRAGHPDSKDVAILPEISSTDIRKSLATSGMIAEAFLPAGVLDYIKEHKLYGR